MLQSMTGFGQVQRETADLNITVEVKSLNSRNFDLNLRLPKDYSYKEPILRSFLYDQLSRGKITLTLDVDYNNPEQLKRNLNADLVRSYYNDISPLAEELGQAKEGLLKILLNFPEAFEAREDPKKEEHWEVIMPHIEKAVRELKDFREQEGENLKSKLSELGNNILREKQGIEDGKEQRLEKVREKLNEKLANYMRQEDVEIDNNRFEQEVLYYLEKLDITEELHRLDSHFQYFFQTLEEQEAGRKLNFITQEIGREINTIGSKINDAGIQRKVVTMKEDLEKIKEQVQNIL